MASSRGDNANATEHGELTEPFNIKSVGDLQDALANHKTWRSAFPRASRGLIFIVILIKFPSPRSAFIRFFKKHSNINSILRRVYQALKDTTMFIAADPTQFLSDVDSIKGPSHGHGFLRLLIDIGVLEKVAPSAKTYDVILGATKNKYNVQSYGTNVGKHIRSFIDMTSFIEDEQVARNVEQYNKNLGAFAERCESLSIPLMFPPAKKQYNKEWCFRQYECGAMRPQKIRRLNVTAATKITGESPFD